MVGLKGRRVGTEVLCALEVQDGGEYTVTQATLDLCGRADDLESAPGPGFDPE